MKKGRRKRVKRRPARCNNALIEKQPVIPVQPRPPAHRTIQFDANVECVVSFGPFDAMRMCEGPDYGPEFAGNQSWVL